MPRSKSRHGLGKDLELRLLHGQCAYCRIHATPETPLTREHLIPRSKGGGRKDHGIIVPACAECNRRRGCQELVLFLLLRPRRISALLDHFFSLSADNLHQIDLRVFAEVYAALGVLDECAALGAAWRVHLRRLCASRTIHRRRYAARRIVTSAGERLEKRREQRRESEGPGCPVPDIQPFHPQLGLDEPLGTTRARLLGLLSTVWGTPAEEVEHEIDRAKRPGSGRPAESELARAEARALTPRHRRRRVDRRRGRAPRTPRGSGRRARAA
ncbi:MAG: HNH endonuclease [Gemmatimonadetes bacterium]|nr:HNH endonuclease [Gemmatimonadota bacterium]